jgi:RNA polymerase sigma factor (sigma-70 family)
LQGITKEQAESIFSEYSPAIYRTANFLCKSKTLAEDITQETFIKVFDKFSTYDQSKPLAPWIYKIALNITRNTLRKQKWVPLLKEVPDKSSAYTIDAKILNNELDQEIWGEINRLSLKSKEIIVLHYYLGLKLNEISSVLGIPQGTCKSRLHTALHSLETRLVKNKIVITGKGEGLFESI